MLSNVVAERPAGIVISDAEESAEPKVDFVSDTKVIGLNQNDDYGPFISHVWVDNEAAGRMAAVSLAAAIRRKYGKASGDVALLTSIPAKKDGFDVAQLKEQFIEVGFRKELSQDYPNIKLKELRGDFGEDRAAAVSQELTLNLLASAPSLRGIFAPNPDVARGVGEALSATNKFGSVIAIGLGVDFENR